MLAAFVRGTAERPSRTIDVQGSDTLDDLHWCIFEAFDREDPHCYQFELGGKKPMDRKATVFSIQDCAEGTRYHDAETTRIDSLALHVGQDMLYWFDFGDDWWHRVTLVSVAPPDGKNMEYPYLVESKGESPPQYCDWDEDDAEEPEMGALASQSMTAEQQQRKEAIQAAVQDFCRAKLDEEYARICALLLEEAWKYGLMLDRSKEKSWAAGIVQAAAVINFLYDPATQPSMRAQEIGKYFGVASSTMSSKGNAVMDALGALPLDPRYCRAALLEDNPLVLLVDRGLFGSGPKRKL